MISCDITQFKKELQDTLRIMVKTKITDFDTNKLFLNATHTHSAPCAGVNEGLDIDKDKGMTGPEFREFLLERMCDAAVEAWKGRAPGGIRQRSWRSGCRAQSQSSVFRWPYRNVRRS